MSDVYSKDHDLISQVCLMEAFRERDLGDFIYALEFLNADVNRADEAGITIFQTILKTPRSAAFIQSCISNGADCYTVRRNNSLEVFKSIYELILLENCQQSISFTFRRRLALPGKSESFPEKL